MRQFLQSMLAVVLLLALTKAPAQGQDGILGAIPSDALAFAVVHNLADASSGLDGVAQLVGAPAPNALAMAKAMTGLAQGLDDGGDAALILLGNAAETKHVILAPVANFGEFFAALQVEEPATGSVVEVQLAGRPMVAGRKGSYAAFTPAPDRAVLEAYLAGTSSLASDAPLAEWIGANTVSGVLTARGVKEFFPKLVEGVRAVQTQMGAMPAGANTSAAADALAMYVNVFTTAQTEVEHFGLGLRIKPGETLALVKRLNFVPGGKWAGLVANVAPLEGDPLAGLQAGPFVMAIGTAVPEGVMGKMMELSVKVMQNQPGFQLTPEQAQRYVQLSAESMRGVRAMRMFLGASEAGAGMYSNTSMVLIVDDPQEYLVGYEKAIATMGELGREAQSPLIPVSTSQRIPFGEAEALEVTMDMSQMSKMSTPGGTDMKNVVQSMWGTTDKLKLFLAPADEHAVVIAYESLEKLREAIDFYKSKQPGLSDDASVKTLSAALPAGSQFVMYLNFGGLMKIAQQLTAANPAAPAVPMPELPENAPLGMAAKVTAQGVDGQLVIGADSLRAIGEAVAKTRSAAPAVSAPQQ